MSEVKIERIEPADTEILEEWGRVTTEPDLLGVDVVRISDGDWAWQVGISVMEFIRTGPLESELESALTAALAAVPGVSDAAQEDRETWAINGNPDGASLVRAASAVLDRYSLRTREALEGLDSGTGGSSWR